METIEEQDATTPGLSPNVAFVAKFVEVKFESLNKFRGISGRYAEEY